MDSDLILLKFPTHHARLAVLLKSAVLLSERTTRVIRMGTKLIVIGVSEPRIAVNVPGNSHCRIYQMPGISEIVQVRWKCAHKSGSLLIAG